MGPRSLLPAGRLFLRRVAFALVVTTVMAAAGLAGGSLVLRHKFRQAKQVSVRLDRGLPGSLNFLVLGSDSRAFVSDSTDAGSFGDSSEVGGQRADVIIVVHVEPRARRALLVSIPRDTLVHLPGRQDVRLINEAFGNGPQGVIDAIRSNFRIPINHYVELDFAGFRSMVDALGGVRMFIPAPSRDKMTGLDITTAGCATLDGNQALAWVRSRYYTYYKAGRWHSDPTADLGRIQRQQDFLRQLMAQAVAKGALSPGRASRLADAALTKLTVDKAFTTRDALRLIEAFRTTGAAGIEMLTLPTRPVGAHLLPTLASEAVLARLRAEAPLPVADHSTAATIVRQGPAGDSRTSIPPPVATKAAPGAAC